MTRKLFVDVLSHIDDMAVLKTLPRKPGMYTAVLNEGKLIALEQGDTTDLLYGICVDIGTTTVVIQLVNLINGEIVGTESMINAQKQYGLDVLSRITHVLENPKDGTKMLQNAIVTSLNEMKDILCHKHNITAQNIYDIAIAANSTMIHLLFGIDPTSLGMSPFIPVFTSAKNTKASIAGLSDCESAARLYTLPAISAYIGGDIVAGAYVTGLEYALSNILFIDIGTNGEIVLSCNGKLVSCSCAAGPALEGMNISCGMRGADGAIEEVSIHNSNIRLKVIGDEPPIGICGSGILAAIRELVKVGLIKKDGAIMKEKNLPENDCRRNLLCTIDGKRDIRLAANPTEITIMQKDIRQVQLAKGAILSGFYALLKQSGISIEQLDKVWIAGQFGSHLAVESLIGCGILPRGIEGKVEYIGNSSQTGAYLALLSKKARREMERLSQKIEYLELGASSGYERLFIDCLEFPDVE